MIWWHHLVEIKRIKKLALSPLLPPHHRPLPRIATSIRRNHGSSIVSMRVLQLLQHNPRKSGHWLSAGMSAKCHKRTSVRVALFDHLVGRGDRGRRAERLNNGQGTVINLAGDVIGRL